VNQFQLKAHFVYVNFLHQSIYFPLHLSSNQTTCSIYCLRITMVLFNFVFLPDRIPYMFILFIYQNEFYIFTFGLQDVLFQCIVIINKIPYICILFAKNKGFFIYQL